MNPRREGLLFLIAVVGLIAGGLLGAFGWQEWIIYSAGSATPQRICLADLAANGPGDNVHVKVTDFMLGIRYVVAAKEGNEKKGPWTRVWMPMFPADPKAGAGANLVVVKTYRFTYPRQAERFYEQATLTGIIINDIHSLGSGERAQFEKYYPGLDFSTALVLEEGRAFPTGQQVFLMLGGAALLLLTALAAAVVWVRAKRRARAAKPTAPKGK